MKRKGGKSQEHRLSLFLLAPFPSPFFFLCLLTEKDMSCSAPPHPPWDGDRNHLNPEQNNPFILYVLSFLQYIYIDKSVLRGKGFIVAHRVLSITTAGSGWQEPEAAAHITSIPRKQRAERACCPPAPFLPLHSPRLRQEMMPQWVGLPLAQDHPQQV